MSKERRLVALVLGCFGSAAWASAPVLVAPGAQGKTLVANSSCPTFSWVAPPASRSFELLVFPVSDQSPGEAPVLRERLPAGATAWTPSADRCLAPGEYAWSLRGVGGRSAEGLSEALSFRIEVDPVEEVRRLKKMVEDLSRRALPSVGENPPTAEAFATSPVDWLGSNAVFPPASCSGTFGDVPSGDFCPWIEAAYQDALLQACANDGGGLRFCPSDAVTRQQAAVLVERVRHGSAGGVLSGSYPDPGLAPAFKLPESCASSALAEWNGSAWICSCGSPGQSCCTGNNCAAGTVCSGGGLCTVCGGPGQPCCAGDSCDPGGVCSGGSCTPCGGLGQTCCAGDSCSAGGVCSGGFCSVCGGLGQACCAGNSCNAGFCVGGVCQP